MNSLGEKAMFEMGLRARFVAIAILSILALTASPSTRAQQIDELGVLPKQAAKKTETAKDWAEQAWERHRREQEAKQQAEQEASEKRTAEERAGPEPKANAEGSKGDPPTKSVSEPAQQAPSAAGARTRFIIGLERPVEFEVFWVTDPNRISIELPDIMLQLPPHPAETPVGLVKSFRSGLSAPGRARVVIEVTGPVIVEEAVVEAARDGKMPRLVLEIAPAKSVLDAERANAKRASMQAARAAVDAGGLTPPMPRPAVLPRARTPSVYKPVIVLDPGHGGEDTGAQADSAVEKTVVLEFCLKLREKLDATGRYKVLMTRDTDVLIDLPARREFAERHLASVFIAVHALDAGKHAKAVMITSLHDPSKEAALAAKGAADVLPEKQLDAVKKVDGDLGAVRELLADLARREIDMAADRTNVLVSGLSAYLGEVSASDVVTASSHPDIEATFRGLKTAKIPSVLIQLGNLTDKSEADNLKSDGWHDRVSSSIVTAIDSYFSHRLARLPM